MTKTYRYLLVLSVLIVTALAGCNADNSRKAAAYRQWQRTVDKVRLKAARRCIEEGNLSYAERVLNRCIQDSPSGSFASDRAQRMLQEVHNASQQFAAASQPDQQLQEQVY